MAKTQTDTPAKEPENTAAIDEGINPSRLNLREELVSVKRVAKVVKGGRRFSFSALVVVGDGNGHVGVGFGKANEVPSAIAKGVEAGKKGLIRVPLLGRTLPHPIVGRYGAAEVLLKPASEGTGIIAGPAVRAVVELAGVQDILTKSLGSNNVLNVVKATLNGLATMRSPEQVAGRRGKSVEEILGKKRAGKIREIYQDAAANAEQAAEEFKKSAPKQRDFKGGGGGRGGPGKKAAVPSVIIATTPPPAAKGKQAVAPPKPEKEAEEVKAPEAEAVKTPAPPAAEALVPPTPKADAVPEAPVDTKAVESKEEKQDS